jgi:hypothetical protein
MIRVNGRRVMLMAILWATEEEIFLLKKYPEVIGHDTKAFVNSTGIPWWYSAGFREDYGTFIIMRGHLANETQAMFNFTMQVALPYIHGEEILRSCMAQIGDAKNEFINTARSMMARGGLTPNGSLLLCAWHLTDRAIHREFKGKMGLWSDSLYRMFWVWQRAETLSHYNKIYEWFKTVWFESDPVRANMSASARNDALSLIENLHMRRQQWALCCNINLVAHDTRVNTFVEVQNHILMDVVHVSKSTGLQAMVSKEALVMERKDRRFAHKNFRTLTTAASYSADEAASSLKKVCGFMKDVMTPSVGKLFTRQVEVAFLCLRNADTNWWLCTKRDCHLCVEDMTSIQREAVDRNSNVLIFHMILRRGDDQEQLQQQAQYASLGEEWDTLHESIPTMKYTRIITAEEVRPGEFLVMCSCGFDFRYQGTCRHISLLLLHASNNECAGCEIGNIALRNTAAFAACRDAKLIQRSPRDWKGILCGHVTEESLCNCPSEGPCDDRDDNQDFQDDQDDHDQRMSRRNIEKTAKWKEMRDAEVTKIQDHFYRVKAKLLSCDKEEFFERAPKVDAHILAAFRELEDVQDRPQSTVAHRYNGDPKRRQRPKTPPTKRTATPQRPAATGGGRYALIHISDSEELEEFVEEIRDGGGSSSD